MGTVNGSRYPDCYNCGGEGTRQEGGPCPACKGTGRLANDSLPKIKKPPSKPTT